MEIYKIRPTYADVKLGNIPIRLDLTKEDVERLKKGFPRTISDLINLVITEAEKETP
jgi:hypothetical protein